MTAPVLAIDPITLDNTINASEAAIGPTISGTTVGVEDGQVVSISVSDGVNPPLIYSATVISNVWLVAMLPGAARLLADGTARSQRALRIRPATRRSRRASRSRSTRPCRR